MAHKKTQREKHAHYCLIVNRSAARYNQSVIKKLTGQIRKTRGRYTLIEPDSAMDTLRQARRAAGASKGRKVFPPSVNRRGPVTSLIACGGDGTFNLVARAALEGNLPIGVLPLGRHNDIANGLLGHCDPDKAIAQIVKRSFCQIDHGTVAGLPFFGSIGMGLLPKLLDTLNERKSPRFAFGWSSLITHVAASVKQLRLVVKVDAFRFEIQPCLFNINLLPYSAGIPISSPSIRDDRQMEILFDVTDDTRKLSTFVRQAVKRKYIYGSDVRLFRGKSISIEPIKGQTLCLDGEQVVLPTNVVDVVIGPKQLRVFC